MAEDRDRDAPSLEPPSLFGRKRRKAAAPSTGRTGRAGRSRRTAARVDPVDAGRRRPTRTRSSTSTTEPTPAAASPLTPPPAPEPPSEPGPPRDPWLTGRPAAVLTGLLVGGLIVAATAGSLRICTEVKGTSSCGGQGFFLLVAILVVAVLVGAALLRARVPEPGSTSFLAVGLLSVVALLFLVGSSCSSGG